jgi:hypothetical protein
MIPRTLFVYKRGGLDTAEIRARQISVPLGADALLLQDLTSDIAARYDVIIYVKRAPERRMLEAIRARGVRQVMDVLDNYSPFQLRSAAPLMDLLIGANLTHMVQLEHKYAVRSIEIPHHHCNFDEQRIPFRRDPVTLGFISTPGHWPENRKIVEPLGLPVVANVRRKGESAFTNLISTYLSIDVAFTWRIDTNKLRFNCANKLTNCMSFGIPSVLTPESGYLEYGLHGETALFAHDKRDFRQLLRWLAADEQLRRRMGDNCYDAARPFHINRIAAKYTEMLESIV